MNYPREHGATVSRAMQHSGVLFLLEPDLSERAQSNEELGKVIEELHKGCE